MKQKYQHNIYSMYTVNPLLNGGCLKSLQYNLQPGILHDDTLYTREQNLFLICGNQCYFYLTFPHIYIYCVCTHVYKHDRTFQGQTIISVMLNQRAIYVQNGRAPQIFAGCTFWQQRADGEAEPSDGPVCVFQIMKFDIACPLIIL